MVKAPTGDVDLQAQIGNLVDVNRKIMHLIALQTIAGRSKTDAVGVLRDAGLDIGEISGLVGTSTGSVRALLSQRSARSGRAE